MRDMIVDSSNDATLYVGLTGPPIRPELPADEMKSGGETQSDQSLLQFSALFKAQRQSETLV